MSDATPRKPLSKAGEIEQARQPFTVPVTAEVTIGKVQLTDRGTNSAIAEVFRLIGSYLAEHGPEFPNVFHCMGIRVTVEEEPER